MTRDEFIKTIEAISAKSRILQSLSLDPEKDAVYNNVRNSVIETSDQAIAEYNRLTARVVELESIVDSLGKDVELLHFQGDKNTVDLMIKHPVFSLFAVNLADLFIEAGGENFLSIQGFSEKIGNFEFLIQRTYGKTPAKLVSELKARIADLENEIENLREDHQWS